MEEAGAISLEGERSGGPGDRRNISSVLREGSLKSSEESDSGIALGSSASICQLTLLDFTPSKRGPKSGTSSARGL